MKNINFLNGYYRGVLSITRLACLALLAILVLGPKIAAQAASFAGPSHISRGVFPGRSAAVSIQNHGQLAAVSARPSTAQPAAPPELSPGAAARSHIPSHVSRAGYLLAGILIIQAAIIVYARIKRRR